MAEPGPQVPGIPASPPFHCIWCRQDSKPNNNRNNMHNLHNGQQIIHLHWSYFKSEFLGKPEEDAEAHLLHTNNWMNAHLFVVGVKVHRFCLTLLGEARLRYQSLEPIIVD